MALFESYVSRLARVRLTQPQFDAIVSWAYNTGGPANSSVWAAVNDPARHAEVPERLSRWNKGGGKVLRGLVRRRKAEGLMWEGRISEALEVAGSIPAGTVSRTREIPKPTAAELARRTPGAVAVAGGNAAGAGSIAVAEPSPDYYTAQVVAMVAFVVIAGFAAVYIARRWAKLSEDWV
jgi:lysozyme